MSNQSAGRMPETGTEQIEIVVNGETRKVAAGHTVRSILAALGVEAERVAVELNQAIVRKPDWDATAVGSGARIEIVQFVGGG